MLTRLKNKADTAMPVSILIGLFFIIWWTVLFAVLPWGVRSQIESGAVVPGSEPGAPVQPLLFKKALWTTALTILIIATIAVLTHWPQANG